MILKPPFEISSRLLPGLRLPGGWIQLEKTGQTDAEDFHLFVWRIDVGREFSGSCLRSNNYQEMFITVLGLLLADAQSYADHRKGHSPTMPYAFHAEIAAWAWSNTDRIKALKAEIESTPNLIGEQ